MERLLRQLKRFLWRPPFKLRVPGTVDPASTAASQEVDPTPTAAPQKNMPQKAPVASQPGTVPIFTLVPDHDPIELVAYYPEFADYYPDCELQTKRWFVENVQPDWIVFDVGAHIGYYSILLSRLAPQGRVFAFEPTCTIDFLRRNLDHNRARNVEPLRIALGAASGRVEGREPERMEYDFATLDDMISHFGLDRLDCVKIDVDSFDFEVLLGAERALERFNPWIVVELNHALVKRGHSVNEVLEWLAARGYEHARILDSENYLMRRETRASWRNRLMGLHLSFEQRPILLPDAFVKGAEIRDFFTSNAVLHNAAFIEHDKVDDDQVIAVRGPRWSYAASWRRTAPQTGTNPILVEIELTVFGAEVGFGCVSPTMDIYIGKQVFALPLPGRQKIVVSALSDGAVGHLVLRNTDPLGREALVRIHGIAAFRGVPSSSRSPLWLHSREKRRLSLADCEAALSGVEPSTALVPSDEPGIDIVAVEELGSTLGFNLPFAAERKVYRKALADFQTEIDESAIYGYIYRNLRPSRHLEFGTWEGFGAALCARSCDAEIWTINLPEGETDAAGNPIYGLAAGDGVSTRSDMGQRIGWRYREAGFGSRVHQILCDSRDFDSSAFGQSFFDSILIDGGHQADVVANDTNKAIPLLRSGGIMIWHDFCPDIETLRRNEAPRGVVRAVIDNFSTWNSSFSKLFWIRPSWLLVGVKS